MNFFRPRAILLSLVSLVATTAFAVEQLPEKEEDIPVEFIPQINYTVSVGLNRLTTGPKVKFGNLGARAFIPSTSSNPSDTISRNYDNGSIAKDSLAFFEKNLDGTALLAGQTITVGATTYRNNGDGTVTAYGPEPTAKLGTDGKPILDANNLYQAVTTPIERLNPDGTITTSDYPVPTLATTAKYLGYQDGQTRLWSVADTSQISTQNHTVSMSTYGVQSSGASAEAESNGTSGFEVSLERKLGQRGNFEWGFAAGLKLADINAKTSSVISANLMKNTDVYKMIDTGHNSASGVIGIYNVQPAASTFYTSILGAGATDASSLNLVDQSGTTIYKYNGVLTAPTTAIAGADFSTLTPLDTNPADVQWGDPLHPVQIGTVNIHGYWQLKGAYYLINIGPTLRYRFNDRFAISGKVALAIAYVGTNFRANESFDNSADVFDLTGALAPRLLISDPTTATVVPNSEENATHKFIPGLYAEFNAEYWVTERTGFYLGIAQQSMRSFKQNPLNSRTATIDMGNSASWQMGIMTRF